MLYQPAPPHPCSSSSGVLDRSGRASRQQGASAGPGTEAGRRGVFLRSAVLTGTPRADHRAPDGWVTADLQVSGAQACLTMLTPRAVALQAPLSMRFSRPAGWRGLPCPPPGDLTPPALAGGLFATSATWEFTFRISRGVTVSQTTSLGPRLLCASLRPSGPAA